METSRDYKGEQLVEFEEPVSLNDKKVQDRFDIADLANCEHQINEIRLKAFSRHPLQHDGPSGQEEQ